MGPETIITKQICDWLNRQPKTIAVKIHASAMQGRGIPDIIACHHGQLLAIEVKRPQLGRLTQIQKYTLQKWSQAGAKTIVATHLNDIKKLINSKQHDEQEQSTWKPKNTNKPSEPDNETKSSETRTKNTSQKSSQHSNKPQETEGSPQT
jgi:Holliday junction resolvase